MENKRNRVKEVMETLSAIAEENAARSEETAAVTEEVNATVNNMYQATKEVDELVVVLHNLVADFKL
jgi:methyl-accepting chemotaxis protein